MTDAWPGKGNNMQNKIESTHIDELLVKADELIQQINSDALKDMEAEQRLQFEKHAQNLKQIKSVVRGQIKKKGIPKKSYGAKGFHEAILDIVKAMQDFKDKLF